MDSKEEKIIDMIRPEFKEKILSEVSGLTFMKYFRSASAEEWYIFLPHYKDPKSGGAAGKAIVHYNLYGNKEVFINTTVILDDPKLHDPELHPLVYSIAEELVNRLVGFADTLLSVHAGENSYNAEYKS
ncbi:hypothetical protein [Paenisporosarcina sp. TG20]|uniref:hypothetical protein n=1 Tax=Paenisporosarcina sp. TG20 TaxID=1211706 RepID=UPI000311283D|nr:hypothetical protein [Paenisporosarcina sp. TG20]